MEVPLEYAMGTPRFSVGRFVTAGEVDQAVGERAQAVGAPARRVGQPSSRLPAPLRHPASAPVYLPRSALDWGTVRARAGLLHRNGQW